MDQPIEDLQVRIAFLEKNIADLDGVVRELGADLAGMASQLQELRESFTDALGDIARSSPKDEVPPHY